MKTWNPQRQRNESLESWKVEQAQGPSTRPSARPPAAPPIRPLAAGYSGYTCGLSALWRACLLRTAGSLALLCVSPADTWCLRHAPGLRAHGSRSQPWCECPPQSLPRALGRWGGLGVSASRSVGTRHGAVSRPAGAGSPCLPAVRGALRVRLQGLHLPGGRERHHLQAQDVPAAAPAQVRGRHLPVHGGGPGQHLLQPRLLQ